MDSTHPGTQGTDNESYGERTTPEACALQRTLASFVSSRVHSVAMEVSSHGLTLNRVAALSSGLLLSPIFHGAI